VKMWSGRFRQALDPAFEVWQRSWEFDCRLLECELEASSAHARALAKADVLSPPELKTILDGLEQIGERVAQDPELLEDDEAEDVHHFVEKLLVAVIGDLGYKLHSGRSRNEQIATDLRLYTRAACDEISAELSKLIATFIDRAERVGDAAMPAYTHLQRAEPVLVAHWLLAYAEMLLRDLQRLEDCRKRLNVCPLGSGAVAGTTLPLDRELMSSELGFTSPTANSMDATSDRDFVVEFANHASLLAIHLSRWAEEMLLFSTQEYGFIHPPEAFSTGSSAMPQKMNGDLLELTRGKSGRIIGNATSLLVLLKGLPLAYNKDMQETQEALFQVTETVVSLIPLVTGWMQSVEFDVARMQRAAENGYVNAFAAATYLVRKGVPFRIAHEIVGKAVRKALDRECELQDLKLTELQELDSHFADDFFEFVTLKNVLAIHDVSGGTAPARVKEAVAAARNRLGAVHEEAHAHA
jgi:argininosuccinate lyase